ncbi:MAG: TIGR03986 family CRISPR-associated RAMP protein [Succinivibrionaceae bacterium]|nr:TIGR03986 family CRISPR-associated RAMP protein [Succinivibrionaceae bacterium]
MNDQKCNTSSSLVPTAPYNFIPYDPSFTTKPGSDEKLYSGTITCSLVVKKALLVAESLSEENREKNVDELGIKKREFFKLNDGKTLCIPGTSLKGMLRSYIEILSQSGITLISNQKLFYRDLTGGIKSKYKRLFPKPQKDMSNNKLIAGGFLFKRGAQYYLAKTNVILVTNQNKDEYIGKDKYETGSMTGKKVLGYYFKELEEPINLEKPNENVIKLDQTVFENFKLQMSKNQEKRWIDEGKRLENGQGARVFYIEVKDEDSTKIEIGMARYFRVGYKFTPKDLALGGKEFNTANDFTLHLFGNAEPNDTMKGKISVEPAYFIKVVPGSDHTYILGTPHPTCIRHYIEQDPKVNKKYFSDLRNYNNDNNSSKLRGRKLYWHRNIEEDITADNGNTNENVNVKTHLCPVGKNSRAIFTIHLDRVNQTELGAIFDCINLPSGYLHKLGLGKSMGLGSVKLTVEEFNIVDQGKRYESLRSRLLGDKSNQINQETIDEARKAFKEHVVKFCKEKVSYERQDFYEEFLAMTDFDHKPENAKTKNMPLNEKDQVCFAKCRDFLPTPHVINPPQVLTSEQNDNK